MKLLAAGASAALLTVVIASSALAQGGDCTVTVSPSTVAVGQQFTVSGNFGGAEIYLVMGANASPAEDAEPDATTPAGSSFSVTFTAEAGDQGTWTVWALIPASECGASAPLTITPAQLSNTATEPQSPVVTLGVLLLAIGAFAAVGRLAATPRGEESRPRGDH